MGLKERLDRLEEKVSPKGGLGSVAIIHENNDGPSEVVVLASSNEEEEAVRERILAEWRAKKSELIPETDPAVLETRLTALEARFKGRNRGTKRTAQ